MRRIVSLLAEVVTIEDEDFLWSEPKSYDDGFTQYTLENHPEEPLVFFDPETKRWNTLIDSPDILTDYAGDSFNTLDEAFEAIEEYLRQETVVPLRR